MSRNRFITLSVVLDAIVITGGYFLAFLLRFAGHLPTFNFNAYLTIAPLITLVYLVGGWTYGLYDPERADTAWAVASTVMLICKRARKLSWRARKALRRSGSAWAR